jgi:hypothetical protein
MKDHQISALATHITVDLNKRLIGFKLPQCVRVIVSESIVKFLTKEKLRFNTDAD